METWKKCEKYIKKAQAADGNGSLALNGLRRVACKLRSRETDRT